MKNAVPAFRFRFSRIDDPLKLLVESCRNVDGYVSLALITLYAAVVSAENNLAFVTTSVCRRTYGRRASPGYPLQQPLHSAGAEQAGGPLIHYRYGLSGKNDQDAAKAWFL